MPVAPLDTYRIKDYDQLNDPAKLLDTVLEAESGSGVDKNYKVTFPTVIQTVANNLPGTNRIKSAYKAVRTYDTLTPGYQVGFDTLVGLDSDTLCIGALARVEFPSPARDYILVLDGNSSLYVYTDGSFTGQKQPARWVEKNSLDNLAAAIADFNPFQAEYKIGDNVKYTLNGVLRIFTAKIDLVKSSFNNNQIPAPTGLATDVNWSEISADVAPNYSRLGQITTRFYYNSERDIYGGDSAEDLIARENAGAGILYTNRTVTVELGPNAGTYRVVYDTANPQFIAWADGLFSGGRNPSSLEKVATGASTPVTNWIAGAQKANTLVQYNGNVYRVKQDIANSQTAPDANAQYYQLINADVTKAYVDAADATLQALIATEKNRIDTLVTNAPQALDTLKEIADQLAADEAGAAAILATQQQHTQQLANDVVHRSGNESIAGSKLLLNELTVNASVYLGNGTDGSGFKLKKVDGTNGYIRAFDLTNTGNTNSINFGAVGEGGDLRAHAQNFIFCTTSGVVVGVVNTAASSLTINGRIAAGNGFVGDGTQLSGLPFYFVGNPANLNIAQGNSLGTNTFTGTYTRNRFGNNVYGNSSGNNFYHNTIEDNFIGNTIGQSFQENHIGNYFTYNTIGDNVSFCTFHSYNTRNRIGANCSYLTFSNLCNYNTIGDNCSQIELYNCSYLTIPAGTTNVVYKNNVQVYPAPASGGSSVTVEQNLSSGSTTSVPSIKAVSDAISAAGGNATAAISRFPSFSVTTDGAQSITLPAGAQDALNVLVMEAAGYIRSIWLEDYSVANNTLTITANANIKAGDKVIGNYFTQATGGGTSGGGGNATNMYVAP